MESLDLVKSGLDLSNTLIQYLSKDAIGSSFLNEYLLSRSSQSKMALEQQDSLHEVIESSSIMEKETREMSVKASENISRLDSIFNEIASLKESVDRIENEHKKYVEQFQTLSTQTQNISKLIDNIQNISEQTNLLSFNASIEAAHAGTAGAGFRIIANEVKKLSASTKQATEEILNNVNILYNSIADIESETKKNTENLNALSKEADGTLEKFAAIRSINAQNDENVEKMSSNIAKNVSNVNEIIENLHKYESINEEKVTLFADCASKNQMLFNDLYSLVYEIKAIFEDLQKNQ